MKPQEIQMLVNVSQALMTIAGERALSLLGMIICASLFGWVLYAPDLIRLAAASLFSVLVYLPVARREQAKAPQPAQGGE